MVLDRDKLKKLLKEKGVKSLDDFNAFMRDVSKDVVETLLEEELTDHLGFEKHDQKAKTVDNTRNGYTPKTVKSKFGEIDLSVPRDRKSEFEPQVVKKRKRDISGLEEKIISMYAKGMTTRDIQSHIKHKQCHRKSPGMAEPASGSYLCCHLHGCRVSEDADRRPCEICGCVYHYRYQSGWS